MPSSKRQRQDIGRQQRHKQIQAQQKVHKRKAGLKRYGIITGVIVLIVGVLLLVNRGGDEETIDVATGGSTTIAAPASVAQTAPGLTAKPVVTTPTGVPPKELQKTDLVVGDGSEAREDSIVTVQYVGVSWSTGKEFDSSWSRDAEPFTANLSGGVIEGWLQGIPGMRVGGRRQLVIPPALAYGDKAQGADIKANETLVFVIDLVSVTAPAAGEVVVGGSTTTISGPAGSTPAS